MTAIIPARSPQRPMRVLIVSGIFPPDIGGPATYVPMLADALLRLGHVPQVITMSDIPPSAAPPFAFPVRRLSRRRSALRRWMSGVSAVARGAREVDVILATGLLIQCAAASSIAPTPLVVRIASDLAWDRATAYGWIADGVEVFHRRRYGIRVEWLRALQRWALRRAALVIVPSRWLARWVSTEGIASERVRVIPNAVEPPPPRPRPAASFDRAPRVTVVGRLVAVKRFDEVIRAVAGIPTARLRIIGDGPERPGLEQVAATAGVRDRIEFAGGMDHAQALGLMADSDVLVVHSAHEGFPHVILEAMASHVPVIAPATGGIPELIEHGRTGLLTDGSTGALAAALRRLLEDPEFAAALAARAAADVRERFSMAAMVDATVRALADAATRRTG